MAASFDEVDVYFKHLSVAESDTSPLGKEVLKILKAASFLVLYNVAEASVRLCVEEIASSISNDKVGPLHLAEPISSLAISQKILKPLRDGQRPETTKKAILSLLMMASRQECLGVPADQFPLGGNVDAAQVRQLVKVFGLDFSSPPSTQGGACLDKIKHHRNSLGHGNQRFGECGNEYTVPELIELKIRFREFLEALLDCVDDYVHRRCYDLEVRLQNLVGPMQTASLIAAFGSPLSVFQTDRAELLKVPGIEEHSAEAICALAPQVLVY